MTRKFGVVISTLLTHASLGKAVKKNYLIIKKSIRIFSETRKNVDLSEAKA